MKNRNRNINVLIFLISISIVLTISVTADDAYSTTNGIYLYVEAAGSSASAQALAGNNSTSATQYFASISVYDKNYTRIDYKTDYDESHAWAISNSVGVTAKGSSSATINGIATSGPSLTVFFN